MAHKFGRETAERIVEEHYRRNQQNIGSSLDQHLREFATGWDGMWKKIVDSFSPEERQKFEGLGSEHQREGFLIVRAFAGVAARKREADFAIARASLADRLSIPSPGATDVIQKLCESEVITLTHRYIRHKQPARFRWLLPLVAHTFRGREAGPLGKNFCVRTNPSSPASLRSANRIGIEGETNIWEMRTPGFTRLALNISTDL